VKYWKTVLAISAALSASLALADDLKTSKGQEYKHAKVSRVEPDGVVIKFSGGIVKIPFTDLSPEIQKKYGYDPKAAGDFQQQTYQADVARARQLAEAMPANTQATEPMAISGIESLPPITVKRNDELLSALKMTDKLDALYKRGCSSAEFVAAALPIESVFMNLQNKLPKTDPRHDLLVNTFDGYQNAAVVMKANEQGKGEPAAAIIVAAGLRKHLLTRILEGNMTAEEKAVYYAWRKALTNP
jgi:hypothetical protein